MRETTQIMMTWLASDVTIFGWTGQNWMAVAAAAAMLGVCYMLFVHEPETP